MKWIVLTAAMTATTLSAQEIERSVAFEDALALWLSDDDAAAIPTLSELAQSGDQAAQLLLGTIEHMGEVQTNWSLNLDRAERIATYRQPEGISGRGWLLDLDTPLAALMRDLDAVDTSVSTILELERMGEGRLAREGLRLMARREQYSDARAVVEALPHYDHIAAPLVTNIEVTRQIAPHDLVYAWCDATCPAVASCAQVAADMLDSPIDSWSLGSPVTALISEEVWRASAKGLASVPRLGDLRDPGVDVTQACIAE
ncbi:hypothetical protein [Pontivivens insulae]|uniref:Uncharacterized protein n=1 Tax=Pontivivens insulae TaxID=1639689 RepID=A0A2R8AEH9_9RHOB|nr:hypothetical protein [Pontivivens insulae]RED11887.1 hypothetical protein DFR53_2598 [Pontivivens insulae]SPF30644.1 hypothetical protein POI8812_02984 [Pontivivens insulae]